MKLLIIGVDGVCPDYIFEHPTLYPNLTRLVEQGASAYYSAYVQKGYHDSYLSEMNWSSIHTGLAPWEHHIAEKKQEGNRQTPQMGSYDGLKPLWDVLNRHGYSMGMWQVDCCTEPVEIDGYVVSAKYEMIEEPRENRIAKREIQFCEKDAWIGKLLGEQVPPRQYPATLAQQGYVFDELKYDSLLAEEAVGKCHFTESIANFDEELRYYFDAMVKAQEYKPVDVMYFYTPTTDLIAHCAMYKDQSEVLVKAYQLVDEYVGRWMEALTPEHIIVLSDHGMVNFKELVQHSDETIRREAFGTRDEVLWLKNGYIAFEAHNGALLYTAHGLKGMFLAAGKGIRHGRIEGMRTLDIYPAILEMLEVSIPDGRQGFVPDIFDRDLVNERYRFNGNENIYKRVAIVQTAAPDDTDIVINEIYLHNRFTWITVVGERRYGEIFIHNPRVETFVAYEDFVASDFDEIYCGICDETSGYKGHIKIKG